MTNALKTLKTPAQLAALLEKIPVGITVIDLAGRICYYNAYCARLVDRQPEYIGRDIRSCHEKAESIARIDRILDAILTGRRKEVCYDTVRNGRTLAVTVSPYEADGRLIGYIQSFVVKRSREGSVRTHGDAAVS